MALSLLRKVPATAGVSAATCRVCSLPGSSFRPGGTRHLQPPWLPFSLASLLRRFNDEEVCTCPQVSVPQQFSSIPWNAFNRDVLKSLYGFAPISMHCNKSTAVRFPVRTASPPRADVLHGKPPGQG